MGGDVWMEISLFDESVADVFYCDCVPYQFSPENYRADKV